MHDKVVKLSMKSLIETNSGKLITLISSDIFSIERGLTFSSFIAASPFINIICYILIGQTAGWWYSLTIFGFWVIVFTSQHFLSKYIKTLKQKEGLVNDDRMKLVNDMIVGIRTIKCYGWENHYLSKIKFIRARQLFYTISISICNNVGPAVFQNVGLIAIIFILLPKWRRGEYLSNDDTFASMAIVFYIFYSVNFLCYHAMTNI
jgi:ATP-binding cassette subfamily C (CFTR/MRP) protein 4